MEKKKMSRDQSGYWGDRDRSRNKDVYRKANRRTKMFGKKYKSR